MSVEPGLACVILAHSDPAQLHRMIAAVDPFPVFLHVDSRVPHEMFRAMTDGLPSRCTVLERFPTGWATWGAVTAELEGYRAALAATDASHVALLSGSDYPIASPAEITGLLASHVDESFALINPLPFPAWGRSGGLSRLRYRHWAFGKRMLRLPIPRRLPKGIVFGGGSSSKILSREHALAVVEVADRHPELVQFWRRSWAGDETFVYSILGSPALVPGWQEHHIDANLWRIDWGETPRKSPAWLGWDHRDALLSRRETPDQLYPHVFARKFSTETSGDLLDAIDAAISRRTTAAAAPSSLADHD
jgi:hypothetical protein